MAGFREAHSTKMPEPASTKAVPQQPEAVALAAKRAEIARRVREAQAKMAREAAEAEASGTPESGTPELAGVQAGAQARAGAQVDSQQDKTGESLPFVSALSGLRKPPDQAPPEPQPEPEPEPKKEPVRHL
eukprot:COSAG01_NODE_1784_length_9237_cov_11.706829_4_plen_131_part_00